MKVLLNSFHLNGHTLGFHPQTFKNPGPNERKLSATLIRELWAGSNSMKCMATKLLLLQASRKLQRKASGSLWRHIGVPCDMKFLRVLIFVIFAVCFTIRKKTVSAKVYSVYEISVSSIQSKIALAGCLNSLPDYLRAAVRFFASSPLSESLEQAKIALVSKKMCHRTTVNTFSNWESQKSVSQKLDPAKHKTRRQFAKLNSRKNFMSHEINALRCPWSEVTIEKRSNILPEHVQAWMQGKRDIHCSRMKVAEK